MAFWTTLVIIHGLLTVALLGAITHQAVSVWMPVRFKVGNFVTGVVGTVRVASRGTSPNR
jgi:hypothetical protein